MQLRCFDGNIHYSFDGLVIVESNHKHQLSNPLIRLFSLLATAAIDQALSIPPLLCPCWSRHLHCVFHCLFLSSARPKIELPKSQSPWRSTVQPSTDARYLPVIGAANLIVLTILLSPAMCRINLL